MCGKCLTTTTSTTVTTSKSCNILSCNNGGRLNSNLCVCECKNIFLINIFGIQVLFLFEFLLKGNPNYSGTTCEIIRCDSEPQTCTAFGISDCLKLSVFYYCPILCGYCKATTTTTTTPTTTATLVPTVTSTSTTTTTSITNVTPTTTTICAVLPCFNGGIYSASSCKCICYPAFTGGFCENLNCSLQPPECITFPAGSCSDDSVKKYCPVLCGLCNSTTITDTTTTTIIDIMNTTTITIDTASTTTTTTTIDTASTTTTTTTIDTVSTTTTTTPTTTTTTTTLTTLSTQSGSCVPITCDYGFPFDPVNCNCKLNQFLKAV